MLSSCIRTAGTLLPYVVSCKQGADKLTRVEFAQVLNRLAESHKPHRNLEPLRHRNHHSALRRTVELGQHHSGERHRVAKTRRLAERILTRVGIEHQPRLMRRARQLTRNDARNLLE